MAEKDFTEKTLEGHNDVFADIVNVLLFQGRQLVDEKHLEDESTRSIYKADGRLHEQERDVAKYWKNRKIRVALLGLENQTNPDADMPLRVFSYDGNAYRAQLLEDKKGVPGARFPVVTMVLYFGYKKPWDKSVYLKDCIQCPVELDPYVNDFKINLFEIAYLEEEQVSLFKSDFKIVADYFVQKRMNKDYVAPKDTIKHVHEFLQLMSAMTNDHRFEEIYSVDMKGGSINMCEVLDKVENKGIEKGIDIILELNNYLLAQNRIDDLKRATGDAQYREQLLKEIFPNGF